MSKEKKFHQLIEEQNQEEKARVWEKIQAKMEQLPQDEVAPINTTKQRSITKWSWKQVTAVASAAAVVCLSIFTIAKFLPHGDISGLESSTGPTQVETSESSSDVDTGDDSLIDTPNNNRYCSADQYTSNTTNKTIKQYAIEAGETWLYFDWYDTTEEVTNLVYHLIETEEVVCYRENIISPETGDLLTLYITDRFTHMDFLEGLGESMKQVSTYNGVQISWGGSSTKAYASFEYGDDVYTIELTEPLMEEDVLEYAKLLLS